MAPDPVPKSGTKIGAAFRADSTTFDCKRGRVSEPDLVPKIGPEFVPCARQIQYTLSANIIFSVETFLQWLLDCATHKSCESAATFIASRGITLHHAAQRTSTSTATLRGGGVVQKTVPPGGP